MWDCFHVIKHEFLCDLSCVEHMLRDFPVLLCARVGKHASSSYSKDKTLLQERVHLQRKVTTLTVSTWHTVTNLKRWLIHSGRGPPPPPPSPSPKTLPTLTCTLPSDPWFYFFPPRIFWFPDITFFFFSMKILPVFSLISQRTLKRAGFILWQFSPCFLFQYKKK